ncbi:MAG TPA: PAS domain-containing sensor histidine kinase, partial [Eubacteriaceae bacterium]|nr:PAS domain-containing sensor histidine kinase [Eubacteriaceae bacterium]
SQEDVTDRQEVDLNTVVESALSIVKPIAHEKGIVFEVENELSVAAVAIKADYLKQVLVNLLTNAVAFSKKQGKVELRIYEQAQYLCIEVKDYGVGISSENINRIFERFYTQSSSRSRDTGGSGLGLAIVKHIVQSANGKIEVESEESKGSRFVVLLPI